MRPHNWLACRKGGCAACESFRWEHILASTGSYRLVSVERGPDWKHPTVAADSPPAVARLVESMTARETEVFICLILNSRNMIRAVNVVSTGLATSSLVHPREFFRPALMAGASATIALHNHPSGDPTPSTDDDGVTKRLVESGNLLGVPLLDHIIVGSGGAYHSYRERGGVPMQGAPLSGVT